MTTLELAVLKIIQLGRDRCGLGWGKYPLGIKDALTELLPLVPGCREVEDANAAFEKRLDR